MLLILVNGESSNLPITLTQPLIRLKDVQRLHDVAYLTTLFNFDPRSEDEVK